MLAEVGSEQGGSLSVDPCSASRAVSGEVAQRLHGVPPAREPDLSAEIVHSRLCLRRPEEHLVSAHLADLLSSFGDEAFIEERALGAFLGGFLPFDVGRGKPGATLLVDENQTAASQSHHDYAHLSLHRILSCQGRYQPLLIEATGARQLF